MSRSLLLVALCACQTPEIPVDPPIGSYIEDADGVEGFEVASSVGGIPLTTVVRAVNRFSAAVPSDEGNFTVDGSSQSVDFDGLGYGVIILDRAASISVDTAINTGTMDAYNSEWPGLGMSRAFESLEFGADAADGLSSGAVVARGSNLYWVGTDAPPHVVLKADGEIRGVRTGNIDVDGIEDALVWTANTVFLLKGRLGGGLAWGKALQSSKHSVGGADIGELNDDNLPDLTIAWAGIDGSSSLDIWHGNGLFEFTPANPRILPVTPMSVAIGDNTGEGRRQITVLGEDGSWSRYINGSEVRYMPIGPRTPVAVPIPLGSTVYGTGDLNDDGAEELYFVGPLNPNSVRSITVVDLLGAKIEFLQLSPLAAYTDRVDMDGNGISNLVQLLSTFQLQSLAFDATSSNSYTPLTLDTLPTYGPVVTQDRIGSDGVPDLFVAGETYWWWWRGLNDPDDSEVHWAVGEPAMGDVADTTGPIAIRELDGDSTTTEIVGFTDDGTTTSMTVWSWDTTTLAITELDSVAMPVGGPVDLAVCGNDAYGALSGQVVRVSLVNLAALSLAATDSTLATRVDCGVGPGGADVALLGDGTVQLTDTNFNELSTLTTPGANDVALGDIGNGAEAFTCFEEGCRAVFWPWGTTESAFASGSDAGISLTDAGGLQPLSGAGALSVYDVDQDGHADLISVASTGMVTLHRSNGDAFGASENYHTRNGPQGAAAFGDADGDGHLDLWMRDGGDRLRHTVAPQVDSDGGENTSGDTADTGLDTGVTTGTTTITTTP